jgi:hypothetical protein
MVMQHTAKGNMKAARPNVSSVRSIDLGTSRSECQLDTRKNLRIAAVS